MRLALAKQRRNGVRAGTVAAEHSVRTAEPEVAKPGNGVGWKGWRIVRGCVVCRIGQQVVELLRVEASEAQVEVLVVQFLQLESQQLVVPGCPRYRAVHKQAKSFHLGF